MQQVLHVLGFELGYSSLYCSWPSRSNKGEGCSSISIVAFVVCGLGEVYFPAASHWSSLQSEAICSSTSCP